MPAFPLVHRWPLRSFNSKMPAWFGTGKRRRTDDIIQTAPYGLRKMLYNHWSQMYRSEHKTLESSRRLAFYNICNSYRDVLCPITSEKSFFVDSCLIHLLNHSLKSIDQGFTSPKVLILVPLARDAHLLVTKLFQLYPSANMAHATGLDLFNNRIVKNTENEDFIISIKLEGERIGLYGAYSNSDKFVASPLGLVTKIWLAEKSNTRDVDEYLSSIELLLVDYSRGKDFKNWAYVPKIVEYLNSRPAMDATDIRPLRRWHVDGEARFYRQTIMLSSSVNQDIKDLFYRHCMNFEGKMEFSYSYSIRRRFPSYSPSLPIGHCNIAMSYPPGNKLKSCVTASGVQRFFISENFPRDFAAHGAWEVDKSYSRDSTNVDIKLSMDWQRLVGLCMPNVSQSGAIENISDEFRRHGKYIDFLNQHNYAQFVVGIFLKYKFDQLMRFLCARVRTFLEPGNVSTIQYRGLEWIGIPRNLFSEYLSLYPPINGADLITNGRWFFYELCSYVTRSGKLARREGFACRGCTFTFSDQGKKKVEVVPVGLADIVYFLEV